MKHDFDARRIARMLLAACALHTGAMLAVAAAIHSDPSSNVLLVPRSEGLFVVGENRFGLTRVKAFAHWREVQNFLKAQHLQVPMLTEAHLRPQGRSSQALASNRSTWVSAYAPHRKQTPIVESNDQETASQVRHWIESGNLQNSKLGFAIPLETKPAASFGL